MICFLKVLNLQTIFNIFNIIKVSKESVTEFKI